MSVTKLARPEIQALKPYQAAEQVADTVRLNANEASWTSGADHFRRPLNRYPEVRPWRLRETLAARFDCRPERLIVTRGTSEAIDLLIRAFCRAGEDNIVTTAPTFSMYRHYATVQNAAVREVTTSADTSFAIDAGALLDACDERSRLVFVCSPNNPTGATIKRDSLIQLLEGRGGRSVIVVDEAYGEFSTEASAVELLEAHDNLVVLRTLSKALAFAGARCGAALGAVEVVALLDAIQAPYAMPTPVVECVEDALGDVWLAEAERRVADVVAERNRLSTALAEMPIVTRVWPSQANFLLVAVADVERVLDRCRQDGVLLRYFGGDLADCLRISVGSADENDRLLDSLGKV